VITNKIWLNRSLLFLGLIILVLFVNGLIRRRLLDPIRVGRSFSSAYMLHDKEKMKKWSHSYVHLKIDSLKFSQIKGQHLFDDREFQLASFKRLGSTIVCSFSYHDILIDIDSPLVYSCVLEPCGPHSWWEEIKQYASYKIPINVLLFLKISPSEPKKRWLVVDFYSRDDFGKELSEFMAWTRRKKTKKLGISDSELADIIYEETGHRPALPLVEKDTSIFGRIDEESLDKLFEILDERGETFLLNWRDSELVTQERGIKRIYRLWDGKEDEGLNK